MKSASEYVQEMESSGIFMNPECTFREYVSEITKFQDMLCQMISGEQYHAGMRFNEATFLMESAARAKGLHNNPAVREGIASMRKLEKEIAITLSGANGESLVSKTLEHVTRPNTSFFRNIYITDGIDETELDNVVITDGGIIILEIKKVKGDLTLTPEGRMVFDNDECFDNVPLAEKMEIKRRLLKYKLEKEFAQKGLTIPVCVDSLIVFSAPKNQYIRITDQSHKDKFCFRTDLPKRIDNYLGYAYYNENELNEIISVFNQLESNVKRFETDLNYDYIRRSIANALEVLNADDQPEVEAEIDQIEVKPESFEQSQEASFDNNDKKTSQRRKSIFNGYIAASVAGLLLSGAAIFIKLAANARQ